MIEMEYISTRTSTSLSHLKFYATLIGKIHLHFIKDIFQNESLNFFLISRHALTNFVLFWQKQFLSNCLLKLKSFGWKKHKTLLRSLKILFSFLFLFFSL